MSDVIFLHFSLAAFDSFPLVVPVKDAVCVSPALRLCSFTLSHPFYCTLYSLGGANGLLFSRLPVRLPSTALRCAAVWGVSAPSHFCACRRPLISPCDFFFPVPASSRRRQRRLSKRPSQTTRRSSPTRPPCRPWSAGPRRPLAGLVTRRLRLSCASRRRMDSRKEAHDEEEQQEKSPSPLLLL